MIESRGKNKTLVVSKSAVPVIDVCDAVIRYQDYNILKTKMPVSLAEVFECIELFIHMPEFPLQPGTDFIEFVYDKDKQVFEVVTLTDLLFLHLIMFGKDLRPGETSFEVLCGLAMHKCMLTALTDITSGKTMFRKNQLYSLIFDCMLEQIGKEAKLTDLLDILREKMQCGDTIISNNKRTPK